MLRIGGKAIRGVKGSRNARFEGYKNIDVTSASRVKLGKHSGREFSPLVGNLKVVDDGRVFNQFENWWQGNKVWQHLDHVVKKGSGWATTKKFKSFQDKWAEQTKGKRVIPESKHHERHDRHDRDYQDKRAKPLFAVYDGQRCDYADARWVYTAKYCYAVKHTPVFNELVKLYKSGELIMLIDHDGPSSQFYPEGRAISWNVIEDSLTDLSKPFGHSYVLAAMLLES